MKKNTQQPAASGHRDTDLLAPRHTAVKKKKDDVKA